MMLAVDPMGQKKLSHTTHVISAYRSTLIPMNQVSCKNCFEDSLESVAERVAEKLRSVIRV
jgi:hypothetical protein